MTAATKTVENSRYQVSYQKRGAMTKRTTIQSRPRSRYKDTLQQNDLYYYMLLHFHIHNERRELFEIEPNVH